MASEQSPAALLLQNQLRDLREHPVDGFSAELVDDKDVFHWCINVKGPGDSFYEGGLFVTLLSFPTSYPYSPPTVIFGSEMWHPKVYPDGKVCISILNPSGDDPYGYELAAERWLPVYTVQSIMVCIISLLSSPNDKAPANVDATKQWREDRDGFEMRVKETVRRSYDYIERLAS